MNKVKQAIADLRSYLGRDTAALILLSKVEKVANEQRVECATEKAKTEKLLARIKTLEGNLTDLEKSHVELKTSLQSANDRASQSDASLRLLQSSIKDEDEVVFDRKDMRSFSNGKNLLKSLQRDMALCPTPFRGSCDFRLSDLASDFRGSEAMRLGKFILFMTAVSVFDYITIHADWKVDKPKDFESYGNVLRWSRTAIDNREDGEILRGLK